MVTFVRGKEVDMRHYIIGTLVAMAIYMILEYIARGYFALGAEILFPIVAYVIYSLNKDEEE